MFASFHLTAASPLSCDLRDAQRFHSEDGQPTVDAAGGEILKRQRGLIERRWDVVSHRGFESI